MKMMSRISYSVVILAVFYLVIVRGGFEGRKCHPHDVTSSDPVCSENESCVSNGTSGICYCKVGFTRSKNSQTECVPNPTPSVPSPELSVATMSPVRGKVVHQNSVSTGAITAAVLVPLMLAVGGILILVGRRYHWFERLQLLQGRRYEEVRIGQEDDEDDDPPLA